jgi:uncharacterized membrane protein
MNVRNALSLAMVALPLLVSAAAAQSGGPRGYVVESGSASGGSYQLTGGGAPSAVEMSGGGYRLQGGVQPALTGNGCCCVLLPCILKH